MATKMKFLIHEGSDGQYYWRLKARNGRIIADGAEGYVSQSNATRAIRRLWNLFLTVDEVEVEYE